jgi:hypothetical protein
MKHMTDPSTVMSMARQRSGDEKTEKKDEERKR